jgi:hypothetical protein
MKTLAGDDVFPKTTNTSLTMYYSSYIKTDLPQTDSVTQKKLLQYFCTDETYPAIVFSVITSSSMGYTPRLYILFYTSTNGMKYSRSVTENSPKFICDLTAQLASARPGEEIVSAQFMLSEHPTRTADQFYKDCVNILSNVFISYTYKN